MSKLLSALEDSPNLASRALTLLLEDERNVQKIKSWIKDQAQYDVRFARLLERAGMNSDSWKELPCVC